MGSTNKTTNLQLSQFLGTDRPAWLTDYNGDMSKIDAAVGNITVSIPEIESDIDSLDTRVGTVEAGVDNAIETANSANVTATNALAVANNANTLAGGAKSDVDELENFVTSNNTLWTLNVTEVEQAIDINNCKHVEIRFTVSVEGTNRRLKMLIDTENDLVDSTRSFNTSYFVSPTSFISLQLSIAKTNIKYAVNAASTIEVTECKAFGKKF